MKRKMGAGKPLVWKHSLSSDVGERTWALLHGKQEMVFACSLQAQRKDQACYKGTSKECHGAKRQGGWETVAISPCSPGRLPEGGEIWAVGPVPPHLSWPWLLPSVHTHVS